MESATTADAPRTLSRAERGRFLGVMTTIHTINDFYGLVLPPLLPALRAAFDLSYTQAGMIPFISTALSAVLQPTLGYVADRRMLRRLFLAGGFLGFALATVWLSFAGSYVAVLLAAGLLGLAASTYHPQSATYLLHYFRENRGFAQGVHGLGNGLGFLLAPVVVGLMVERLGWPTATRLLAIPAIVAAAIVLLALREPQVRGGVGMFAGVTRALLGLTVVNGLSLATFNGFQVWLPSYYSAQGYSLAEAGLLTGLMSASGLIAQPAGGTLSDRFGRRAVVFGSLAGTGVFVLLFLAAPSLPLMFVGSLLVGFCALLMPPVAMVYASELAAGQRTGMAVGIVWGMGMLIASSSPLISGALIDVFGFGVAYAALATAALVGAGLSRRLPG